MERPTVYSHLSVFQHEQAEEFGNPPTLDQLLSVALFGDG